MHAIRVRRRQDRKKMKRLSVILLNYETCATMISKLHLGGQTKGKNKN